MNSSIYLNILKHTLNRKKRLKKFPEDGLQLDPERVFGCLQKESSRALTLGLGLAHHHVSTDKCRLKKKKKINTVALIRSLKLRPAQQNMIW